ncbi:MAG: twin-arginine translocase TatA/TatE family subunit [Candidatus Acidiferrales bacterium]
MGPIGIPELIFIFLIALLIFGPKKLPDLGRNIGKALTEFRRASNDLRHAVEEEMREVERQAAEAKRAATDAVSAVSLDELGSINPHAANPQNDHSHAGPETVPADLPAIGDPPTNSPAGSRRYEKRAHGDV